LDSCGKKLISLVEEVGGVGSDRPTHQKDQVDKGRRSRDEDVGEGEEGVDKTSARVLNGT